MSERNSKRDSLEEKRKLKNEYHELTKEENSLEDSLNDENNEDYADNENSSEIDEEVDNSSEEQESDDEMSEQEKDNSSRDSKNDEETSEDVRSNVEDRRSLGPQHQEETSDKNEELKKQSLKDKATNEIKEKISNESETLQKAEKTKEFAVKSAAVLKSVASKALTAVKIVVNPFFWIAVGIILVITIVISAFAIIGGNDYNQLCDNDGIGSITIGSDADDFTRQSAIASWLMSTSFEATGGQPMTIEQAAGVMGNFIQESYGANPKAIQGNPSMTSWQTCDNDCVLGWGDVGGKAIGVAQWDRGRRTTLVNFAKSEGTEWYDLTTQMKFLKVELDGSNGNDYEKNQLIQGGFGVPGKSIEEYTQIWLEKYERAGVGVAEIRKQYAREFHSRFDGSGVSGGGGLVAKCVGGYGAVDASSLAQLAVQIAYTREEKAAGLGYGSCGGSYAGCGQSFSKPEYIDAKKMVEEQTGRDPLPGLLASCDRLVATMVRLTGIDENFPYGGTGTQLNYMNSNPNWERVSCQNRQPGDVFGRSGHIMIYVGEIDGKETVVSASISHRSAHMSNISCSGDLFRGDAMSVPGYRKVN